MAMPAISRDKCLRSIELPGSKSIAARALVLDRVYRLGLQFSNLPDCTDTCELRQALRDFPRASHYNLGSGGTSLRFFLALAASTPGFNGTIDCDDALRVRPLTPLISALRSAGAEIECIGQEGRAPLRVRGNRLDGRGVSVDTGISSQFTSALLMVSPHWEHPFRPEEEPGAVSRPYVEMTRRMCEEFSRMPKNGSYHIESDWSAASYFYEWALLNPDIELLLCGLEPSERSLQGDSACAAIFERLGVYTRFHRDGAIIVGTPRRFDTPVELDMRDTPDLVPALVAGMCGARIPFRICGVSHLRHKESDRCEALQDELGKLGHRIEIGPDSITYNAEKPAPTTGSRLSAHGDHRIAMSVSVLASKSGEFTLENPESVRKSFSDFFSVLDSLTCRG